MSWYKGEINKMEAKCMTLIISSGGYAVVLIFSKKPGEKRKNQSKLCSVRNNEFFEINIRNEHLKSFIIKRDKAIDVAI